MNNDKHAALRKALKIIREWRSPYMRANTEAVCALLADYDALRAERDEMSAALGELVELKRMKGQIILGNADAQIEYDKRKHAAWLKAINLISPPPEPASPEQEAALQAMTPMTDRLR